MNKIVILGGGKSGLGSALLAKRNNYNVFVSDAGYISDSTKDILVNSSIKFEENSHDKAKTIDPDLIVKSPGISPNSDIIIFFKSKSVKMISEIDFKFPVILGDVIEIGMQTLDIGKTSCTLSCEVRSLHADKTVLTIDKIVYVRVNKYGLPKGHGWMSNG